MTQVVPSLLMLAAIALVIGAIVGWRRGMAPKKVGLMVLAALVMFANVAIWTIPNQRGESLVTQTAE
ncbi:MAG: hypothetical protein GW859_10260 [Sphingomonadales bacterium]|nr:hypothetical protein [Sphingomonadales bacterium]